MFVGGHPALDFVNTAGGSTKVRDKDRLVELGDAIDWALAVELLAPEEALTLRGARDTDATLDRLREQREALHAYLSAAALGEEPDAAARSRVEADVRGAYACARLSGRPGEPDVWTVPMAEAGVDVLAHRIALTTATLLTSADAKAVRVCQACSWLYLDLSPTRRRRWCSMATCGNRAKARRHRAKQP